MSEHVCMYTKYTCIHASALVLWDVVSPGIDAVCALCFFNFILFGFCDDFYIRARGVDFFSVLWFSVIEFS